MASEKQYPILEPTPNVEPTAAPELTPSPVKKGVELVKGEREPVDMRSTYSGELPEIHGHIVAKSVKSKGYVQIPNAKYLIDRNGNQILVDIYELIQTVREGQYVVVDTEEYPTLEDFLDSEGRQGTVYLYPVGNQANNYYQYVWETGDWISLGTTNLDLSGYIKGEYLTQAEYDALETKDPNKYYFIPEGE